MCNGLLWLFGLKEEEGLKPRAARSRLALKVQCLGATNAFLFFFFFFLKREIKILINYTNIFKRKKSRTFLKPIIGFQEHNNKNKVMSKFRPPHGRFFSPYTIVFSCTSGYGMMVNKS